MKAEIHRFLLLEDVQIINHPGYIFFQAICWYFLQLFFIRNSHAANLFPNNLTYHIL